MGLKTFKGGVHPYEGKELAKDAADRGSFTQGRPGVSVITAYRSTSKSNCSERRYRIKRDRRSQKRAVLYLLQSMHLLSGTVKAIEPRRVAVGDMVNSIVIENDGEYRRRLSYTPCEDVTALIQGRDHW